MLTQTEMDAMDETMGYVRPDIELPVKHGGDLRVLAIAPAPEAAKLAAGTMSLNIDGWED